VEKRQIPENVIRVTFDMPKTLAQQLERLQRKQDRSRAWVIRQLLVRALAQQEKTA
jgi:metal-responsive CopG/Arc/MetJ family transcriptional regulator